MGFRKLNYEQIAKQIDSECATKSITSMQYSAATRNIMAPCVKIMVLFLSFSTGFCCNSGWFAFEGVCYQISQHIYSLELAKRYCELAGGQIAYINKSDTLQFLNTIPHYDGKEHYWIDERSSISNSSALDSSVNCAYAELQKTIQKIDREFCKEKKYFICQMKEEKYPDVCPVGFDRHGHNCYRPITNKANYVDAKKFCVLQKSRLAILDSETKEWEAKAMVIGRNQTFIVDAKRNEGILKWANGQLLETDFKRFYIDGNESAPSSGGDCVGLLSEADEPTVFSWVHLDCEQKNSFLCEADPVMTTTTREPTTTTTEMPLSCPHGMNWKSHESSGFCFWETTYETDRLNWYQAREFCRTFGGDLASYDSEEQENAGLAGARGHFNGLWIGLKRDENNVFHWVDGSLLTYTNWDWNEPNLASRSEFCVTHASGSAKWELDYCGIRRWFVCKAPKVRIPTHVERYHDTKKPCDVKSVSVYRNQWYMYEDHCYMVQERHKYTWDTAKQFCQDNDAHLASIHSFNETNFILTLMSIHPETDFWVGLSAQGLGSSHVWSDNTPLDFLYWADNKTEAEGLNRCISFNKKDGSWSTTHCNRLQFAVCKRGINASYDFTTTEPTTVMPGNCENGWYNFGNKCYKYFGKQWSQRVQWTIAKQKCEEIGASLASIHNQAEQDILTDVVLEAGTDVWIGLHSNDGGMLFHWSDDSRIDYTNWDENEPDFNSDNDLFMTERSNEACVEVAYGEKTMGKWNDISCLKKKGYICEKMKDPTLTGPYEDPFICPNISGWYRLGSSCYGFFEEKQLTWLDAQAECRKYGADLMTYRSSAVPIFVKRKLKLKDGYVWIGARETTKDKYEFFAGSPIFLADWVAGQPQAASTFLDNCVAMTTTGGWVVKSCKDKHPFICRFTTETEPEPKVDVTSSCEELNGDWYDFGGESCYLLDAGVRLTWGDAMHYCFKHGGFLASFHSADEINEVQKYISYHSRPLSLHIGLGRKYDGSFGWVDSSPFDYINWDDGEPDSPEKQCVEMYVPTGKWNDVDCDETYRGFICSHRKRTVSGLALEISQNNTSQKESVSHKLAAGGIFGIVMCILVIFAVIGMTVYYLRPTKQVQPKLLDSDQL